MEVQSMLKDIAERFVTGNSDCLFPKANVENKSKSDFQSYLKKESIDGSEVKSGTSDAGTRMQRMDGSNNNQMIKEKALESSKSGVQEVSGKNDVSGKTEDITAEDVEAAVEWMQQVKKVVCETLDISEEELEKVMEQLGISLGELQQYSNIQDLVLAVNGSDDKMLLLTDENMGNQVQELMFNMANIGKELQIDTVMSDEKLCEIVEKVDAFLEESKITLEDFQGELYKYQENESMQKGSEQENTLNQQMDETTVFVENGTKMQKTEDASNPKKVATHVEQNVVKEEETNQQVQANKEDFVEMPEKLNHEPLQQKQEVLQPQQQDNVQKQIPVEDESLKSEHVDQDLPKVKFSVEKQELIASQPERQEHFENSEKDGQNMFQQFMEQLSVHKVDGTSYVNEQVDASTSLDFQDVVQQVVEQIKVLVKENTTTMEMQLNPEHLGKVSLTVVSKDGRITAQFATETEVAKQALETQIQQLRENLGNQGLKVDEVEVTVSNFDFTKQNQANAEQQKEEQRNQQAKRTQRNLNLNDLASMDLGEAEELAAKIMISNGNQIDYSA